MAISRVCVIGAGTIGSLLAGHLGGVCEVSVLTRRPEHAAMLREHGLRISGKHERHVELFATDDPAALPPFDIGIIACKALNLELTASRLHGHAGDGVMMTATAPGRSSPPSPS
jgi:2-dehydropantoate 2-reductase